MKTGWADPSSDHDLRGRPSTMALQDRDTQHEDYDEGLHAPFEPPSLAGHQDHYRTDKVVFGVSAALMVAFIAWGVLGTDSLSTVASTVLSGIMNGGGWAFVLA